MKDNFYYIIDGEPSQAQKALSVNKFGAFRKSLDNSQTLLKLFANDNKAHGVFKSLTKYTNAQIKVILSGSAWTDNTAPRP